MLTKLLAITIILGVAVGCKNDNSDRPMKPPYEPNYVSAVSPVTWPDDVKTITYSITNADSSIPFVDAEKAVIAGVNQWEQSLDGFKSLSKVSVITSDIPALVEIRFVSTTEMMIAAGRQGVAGYTTLAYRQDGRLKSATCLIVNNKLPTELKKIAAHEFGHAMGMRGHSPNKNDLMSPSPSILAGVNNTDHNTMRSIYDPAAKLPKSTRSTNKPSDSFVD